MSAIDEVLARVRELDAAAPSSPWTHSPSTGAPGHGWAAQVWDADGTALLFPERVVGARSDAVVAIVVEYRTLAPRLAKAVEILVADARGHIEGIAPWAVDSIDPDTGADLPVCARCSELWPCATADALAAAEQALAGEEPKVEGD